ncbi:hypothetical protein V8E54_010336 [Elaphomyces granulatus]
MTPNMEAILSSQDWKSQSLEISSDDFLKFKDALNESKRKYKYNATDGVLTVEIPIRIHGSPQPLFQDWLAAIKASGKIARDSLSFVSDVSLRNFGGRWTGCPRPRTGVSFLQVQESGSAEFDQILK